MWTTNAHTLLPYKELEHMSIEDRVDMIARYVYMCR